MAGGLLPIIFETKSGILVFSETDLSKINLPDVYQEDGIYLAFQAVKQISRTSLPMAEKIPLTGYALRISIGLAGAIKAQATPGDFTLSADGYTYVGTLNLNTAEILAALGTGTYVDLLFEVYLSTGAVLHRGQYPVKVRKSVHTTGSLVAVGTDRALGAQEASRTFAPLNDIRSLQWLTSSGRRFLQYMHDDGTPRFEEIT